MDASGKRREEGYVIFKIPISRSKANSDQCFVWWRKLFLSSPYFYNVFSALLPLPPLLSTFLSSLFFLIVPSLFNIPIYTHKKSPYKICVFNKKGKIFWKKKKGESCLDLRGWRPYSSVIPPKKKSYQNGWVPIKFS